MIKVILCVISIFMIIISEVFWDIEKNNDISLIYAIILGLLEFFGIITLILISIF